MDGLDTGEEMTGMEKLGRGAWIAFLIAASPVALFGVGMTLLWARSLFLEEMGPVEVDPLPSLPKVVVLSSMISFPITWILGVTIAHRFNGPGLSTIPFLSNLLPTSGLLGFSFILTRDEGGAWVWSTAYTGLLAVLLGLGLVAVLVSAGRKQQAPDKSDRPRAGKMPV